MGEQLVDLVVDELDEKAGSAQEADVGELAERVRQLAEMQETEE